MIDVNDPIVKERFQLLDPEYAKFILSDFSTEVAGVLGKKKGFTEEKTTILHNGISLFLLLFLSEEELRNFIITECEVPREDADAFTYVITSSLPPALLQPQSQGYTALNNLTDSSETSVPTPPSAPKPEIPKLDLTIKNKVVPTPPPSPIHRPISDLSHKSSDQDSLLKR